MGRQWNWNPPNPQPALCLFSLELDSPSLTAAHDGSRRHLHFVTHSSLPSPRRSSLLISHGFTSSRSRSLTSSPHLVVVFLLLKVSVSHLASISPFPALFVAGSRGNIFRWAYLRCRLLASNLTVSFSLAISFSFAVNFLLATRFVPSDTGVGENEDDSAISVRDAVNLDPQVAGGVVNLKEKDSAEFPSVLGQDDSPLGSNSVVITNASIRDVQLESAHVQFSNSSDAQTLLEKEEENTNSNILPTSVDRTEESPSAQALINDAAKEWNSPARYPTEMKREKWKAKSRPYWIQLVCSSSVDLQRRQKTAI
ncbi:hypothetical protein Ahy_A06g025868 [Arachis hypogaea]|uniref:Uncharacterized protein n=1 Tax=Arachis hypogaea TaxID=3818 RepID=A0A445CIW6_ARAHY|nr:hypothetical protein Ahy_A06g025868 [Arachis hypogaea]